MLKLNSGHHLDIFKLERFGKMNFLILARDFGLFGYFSSVINFQTLSVDTCHYRSELSTM